MGLPGPEIIEKAGLLAWPGIEVEWDGSWVRRASNGYTQRANSVQSLDPDDDADIPARIAESRKWFESRGLRPIFRLTPLASQRIAEELDAQGWRRVDDSDVLAMELAPVEPDPRGEILPLLDPRFLEVQRQLRNYSDEKLAGLTALLGAMEVPACGIVLYSPEGEPAASALMAIADGIVVTGNVITSASHRRKGHGAAMMRTGHAWAARNGAVVAALNVVADNESGKALYHSLGYVRQYGYSYRVPGPA